MIDKKKFEENYFEGWYKSAVGDFTERDLAIQMNWFWAWIVKLNQYVNVFGNRKKKILEIGCSIGAVSHILADLGHDVWASDISRYAVKNAKKLTPKANFSVIDVQNKIELKQRFDLVIAFEVVEHLETPEKAVSNMYNALNKGGEIVISTPYPYQWNYRDPTHINVKHPEEWVKIMKEAGFKKVKYHRFSLMPFFYRYNKRLQLILPFALPIPYINSPIFFIGTK